MILFLPSLAVADDISKPVDPYGSGNDSLVAGLHSSSENSLTTEQQAMAGGNWQTIGDLDPDGKSTCLPWRQWPAYFGATHDCGFGIDLQALGVLNQSPSGQPPFFSRDFSVNAVARGWDLWKRDSVPSSIGSLAVLHEPSLGVTESIHFRDAADTANRSSQMPGFTIHPLLSVQSDLVNYTFKRGGHSWLEFKITIAPQVDLYGRYTGKRASLQWPMQPNVEWHLTDSYSVVFQVSIPVFTVGGGNAPPSFGAGILWHAKDDLNKKE
jgi:hypothetical protein